MIELIRDTKEEFDRYTIGKVTKIASASLRSTERSCSITLGFDKLACDEKINFHVCNHRLTLIRRAKGYDFNVNLHVSFHSNDVLRVFCDQMKSVHEKDPSFTFSIIFSGISIALENQNRSQVLFFIESYYATMISLKDNMLFL